MTRNQLLCSVFAAAVSFGAAHAGAPVVVNGGGSSLAFPTYASEYSTYSASKPSDLFTYAAVGSGTGQNAFLNNKIGYFEPLSGSNTIGYAAGTLTYGTVVGSAVDFGASDAVLSSAQVSGYTLASVDGPLIQVPTIGVPITIAYNESGVPAATYTSAPGGGNGLVLSDSQICGVLSGKITDWNSLVSTIPSGTPITVVYRTDSSGTTFLLSQHLDAVCTTGVSGNSNFTAAGLAAPTKVFTSLFSNGTFPTSGFVGGAQSAGVQTADLTTSGAFSYLSPDYTDIAPASLNSPKNVNFVPPAGTPAGTTLPVAAVTNPNAGTGGTAYFPTVTNTQLGLTNPGAGSTNPTPPNTLSAASNPLNWVPLVPQTTTGYSIVGYTTEDLSQCYSPTSSKNVGKLIEAILKDTYEKSGPYYTIITNNGFAPLLKTKAASYVTAIEDDFTSNKSGYNLDIDDSTVCSSYSGR